MYHDSYLSDDQVDCLARQIASYDLPRDYATFQWKGVTLPKAWLVRQELEDSTRRFDPNNPLCLADRIHRWGFESNVPESIRKEPFSEIFRNLIAAWSVPGLGLTQKEPKTAALAEMLSIPRVGIARASKWICFVDQSKYAIYDSRVSLALRNLTLNNERVFPIVGRKAPKGRIAWYQDAVTSNPRRMAELYWSYTRVMNRTANLVQHHDGHQRKYYPAEVEMALFMKGDVWPMASERMPGAWRC